MDCGLRRCVIVMKRVVCILVPWFVLSGCTMTTIPSSDGSEESRDDLSDSDSEDSTPAKKKSSTSKSDQAPATTPPAAPAADPDVTYTAVIPETEKSAFGGVTADRKEVCGVQSWKNVTITVVANDKGQTRSFTFKGTNVEQANPACPGVTAQPENEHTYTFTSTAPKDAPAKLVAAPGNKPQAELVADVAVHAEAGGRVTIHFHRTDAAAPLDWRYTSQFTLTKQ